MISVYFVPVYAGDCVYRPITIRGTSMARHIKDGAVVTIKQGAAECIFPAAHGDAVLFQADSAHIPLIKFLRGLPGDTFSINYGQILINGHVAENSEGVAYQLSDPRAAMIGLYAHDYGGIIPPEMYLVMGENPTGTTDSSRFGLIGRDQIIGKVIERRHE